MIVNFFNFVGLIVVAGGSITAIAYALFRFLGEKWLESKFAERMADYRHKQQKELEELRFKINSLFDRTTKLHQREFEILPEVWGRLNDAYWPARAFASPLQTYPDLNRMPEPQVDDFLKNSPLSGWQKEELKGMKDKTKYYQDAIFWHRLNDCQNRARDFHVYLLKNGIFLMPQIRNQFAEIEDIVWKALDEQALIKKLPEQRFKADSSEAALRIEGNKLIEKLESNIHGRLWNSELDRPTMTVNKL